VHEDVSAAAVWGDEAEPFSELNHLTVPCAMFCFLDRWWKRTVNLMADRSSGDGNLRATSPGGRSRARNISSCEVVKHEHKTDDHR